MPLRDVGGKLQRACVIGSGPNGLAAAIVLAQAGLRVEVFEAEAEPGGASRTLPLTLPGFLHDFGSAVHPLAAGSPFFTTLPLSEFGLEWVHGDAPLAHPLDDGTAVTVERDLDANDAALGADAKAGAAWLRPPLSTGSSLRQTFWPRHCTFRITRCAWRASACLRSNPRNRWCAGIFRAHAPGLCLRGWPAHSFLSLDRPLTAGIGLMFAASLHAVGWPSPRGGARAIPHALIGYLRIAGRRGAHLARASMRAAVSRAKPRWRVDDVRPDAAPVAGHRRRPAHPRTSAGAGRFSLWPRRVQSGLRALRARALARARMPARHYRAPRRKFEEIAESESDVAQGRVPERPFVLAAQPTLFDPSRAPRGKHVLWAYCHVPNSSAADMTARIDAQIERFAPGFRDCILARACLPAGTPRSHGCKPDRRRHLRRRHQREPASLPSHAARIRHQQPEDFSLLRRPRRRAQACTACAAITPPMAMALRRISLHTARAGPKASDPGSMVRFGSAPEAWAASSTADY